MIRLVSAGWLPGATDAGWSGSGRDYALLAMASRLTGRETLFVEAYREAVRRGVDLTRFVDEVAAAGIVP